MTFKNKEKLTAPQARKIATISLIGLILALVILGGLGTGKLQYTVAAIRCARAPIEASRFMASYTYNRPTDPSYRPSIFSEYFCTEQEAQKAGFRADVASEAQKKQSETLTAQRAEEKRFSPEKVNYTVYIPSGKYTRDDIEISKMSGNELHSFFTIKEDGYAVAQVREGAIPSDYQLCKHTGYTCTTIGKGARGGDIIKQLSGNDNDNVSYAMNIGTTFITLTGVYEELTNEDIISIFNSLKEYTDV